MEPEIDRRCPACGAAVRPHAAFCQQCGRPMKAGAQAAASPPALTDDAATPEAAETPKPKLAEREATSAPRSFPSQPRASEPPSGVQPSPVEPISLPARIAREQMNPGTVVEPSPVSPDDGARKRRQRVAAAARDAVEERIAPRVEKLRQASNVVLDEAADDPNLRFILVAVLLFIIALVLILVSTYFR